MTHLNLAPTLAAGATATVVATLMTAAPVVAAPPTWSRAVGHICANALLFEHRHQIGTRAGAVAVARDIRASTDRRITRIAGLSVRPTRRSRAAHWLAVERRLAAVYARSYLRIFEVIDAAKTVRQRARVPRLLGGLLHAHDRLGRIAARLEVVLQVPDCTGGHPENHVNSAASPIPR